MLGGNVICTSTSKIGCCISYYVLLYELTRRWCTFLLQTFNLFFLHNVVVTQNICKVASEAGQIALLELRMNQSLLLSFLFNFPLIFPPSSKKFLVQQHQKQSKKKNPTHNPLFTFLSFFSLSMKSRWDSWCWGYH